MPNNINKRIEEIKKEFREKYPQFDYPTVFDYLQFAYNQGKKDGEAIDLLKRIRRYVNDSSGFGVMTLVYIPPAQAMRNAADEMEAKDALLREVDNFLSTLNETK